MKKTIGVFAHVDAGKTTFSEQLLFHTNAIRSLGRVDTKDTFLDSHEVEKRRGITIFSDQGIFELNNNTYYLIDTPGHVDFSSEMERSISILDYAIIIISGIDGVESHTETVFELLNKNSVPIFIFVNKMDQGHADFNNVFLNLKDSLSGNVVDFNNGVINDLVAEEISMYDEDLMEYYLEYGYDKNKFDFVISNLIKNRSMIPVYSGSALKDIGIDSFLNGLDKYTNTSYDSFDDVPKGIVYKIKYDNNIRHTYIKLLSGCFKVRDFLKEEKITSIFKHNGLKTISCNEVCSGDIFSVIGIKDLNAGDSFGGVSNVVYEMVPTLRSKVTFNNVNVNDVLRDMRILEAEDPSLNVLWIDQKKEILIGIMGVIQIEILKEVILNRFNYVLDFEEPSIIYKETISNEVIGYGHFEPLKHYCEIHLKISKGSLGSGIVFDSICHVESLSIGNQNLVKHHIFEKIHNGILTGSEITDIKITLLTGRAHKEYTSGGDFREATVRALRQGLEQANNVLLEPFYTAKITVPMELLGRIMTDVQKAFGESKPPVQIGDKIILEAKVPVSTFKDYSTELASLSSGKGRVSLSVSGYDVCHNSDDVIEEIDYKKELDFNYPSSSVFCTKGKGYTVKWDVAKSYMHCLK